MSKKLTLYEILGICFVIVSGMLLHFLYDFSNQNQIVGLFGPINESTWEHFKLLFFPFTLYTLFECIIIGHEYDNFMIAKVIGVLTGMFFLVSSFYTYTGIIGTNYVLVDILLFILSVLLAFKVETILLQQNSLVRFNTIGLFLFFILILCFFIFTFMPPDIALFDDPNL